MKETEKERDITTTVGEASWRGQVKVRPIAQGYLGLLWNEGRLLLLEEGEKKGHWGRCREDPKRWGRKWQKFSHVMGSGVTY